MAESRTDLSSLATWACVGITSSGIEANLNSKPEDVILGLGPSSAARGLGLPRASHDTRCNLPSSSTPPAPSPSLRPRHLCPYLLVAFKLGPRQKKELGWWR